MKNTSERKNGVRGDVTCLKGSGYIGEFGVVPGRGRGSYVQIPRGGCGRKEKG